MTAIRSILAGVGGYLPERIVTNNELARELETSDLWIRERTGIRQRHIAGPRETAAFMGTEAARAALADAGAEHTEVDAIILATSTPDQAFPATALRVQAALGVPGGFGFDLSAACAGFIYALAGGDGTIDQTISHCCGGYPICSTFRAIRSRAYSVSSEKGVEG